jgi:hypothetical protein
MNWHGPMSNVLLLRAASQDSPDRYENAFKSRGYHPISVPVLETVIVCHEELARRLSIGPEKQSLSGVIITSQRAVEAWSEAAQALITADNNTPLKPESGMVYWLNALNQISQPNRLVFCSILCSRRSYVGRAS